MNVRARAPSQTIYETARETEISFTDLDFLCVCLANKGCTTNTEVGGVIAVSWGGMAMINLT